MQPAGVVVVICHVCNAPPVGQCRRCWKSYCRNHGDTYCEQCRPEEPAPSEPQFLPSDQGVRVVVAPASVQELMCILPALDSLPERNKAYAAGFLNGEASFQLELRSPIAARKILDMVEQATGEELLIEECNPDAQRLRLRFVGRLSADPRVNPE